MFVAILQSKKLNSFVAVTIVVIVCPIKKLSMLGFPWNSWMNLEKNHTRNSILKKVP